MTRLAGGIRQVNRWKYIRNCPHPWYFGGINFDVKPARGYEVTVTTDTTWAPQ